VLETADLFGISLEEQGTEMRQLRRMMKNGARFCSEASFIERCLDKQFVRVLEAGNGIFDNCNGLNWIFAHSLRKAYRTYVLSFDLCQRPSGSGACISIKYCKSAQDFASTKGS